FVAKLFGIADQFVVIIEVKPGKGGAAALNEMIHHRHQRRLRTFEVRGQQRQKVILFRAAKEVPETPLRVFLIELHIVYQVTAYRLTRGAAAAKLPLRTPASGLDRVMFEERDRQERYFIRRGYMGRVCAQEINILSV